MPQYLGIETRQVIVEANSAAEARAKFEAVVYARPGFDKAARRDLRVTSITVEKVKE